MGRRYAIRSRMQPPENSSEIESPLMWVAAVVAHVASHLRSRPCEPAAGVSLLGRGSVTRLCQGCILLGAAIGTRERVYEPGQDRKIATVLHVSVMRFRSPYFSHSL